MYHPIVNAHKTTRLVTDTFAGYNHRLKIADGEWYDTKNLTTLRHPLLSNRPKRGTLGPTAETYDATKTYALGDYCMYGGSMYRCTTAITTAEAWNAEHWTAVSGFGNLQAVIAKDALYWVDNGTLYANGYATGLTGLQTVKPTQLVSMGAYICVFPDAKYINTMNLTDFGSMGAVWNYTGSVTYTMCHQDGEIYENVIKAATEPSDPDNGDVWIDTSSGDVKEWSVYTETWVVIETVFTRVDFTTDGQVPQLFKEYDGVQITGMFEDATSTLNGSKILYAVGTQAGADYVVLVGIQETQRTVSSTVKIERKIPQMDYVCEAQNRLWGCFYGNDGTQNLNEIYCCALGDFRNWEQYLGVSTDSWRGSRGSDGPFSGCINFFGTPTFFKENIIHPVHVSAVCAHQIDDIPARGVQLGSWRSLAVVGETLYYKSRTGIMAYQGGIPGEVGQALGEEKYYDAAAGVYGQRYVISMRDGQNNWNLFVLDTSLGLWVREDNLHAEGFAWWGDELYAMANNQILALNGTEGTLENDVEWYAESGMQYYSYPDRKYVSRFDIRLSMERNARAQVYIEYDSSGLWQYMGEIRVADVGTSVVPVRPRRCDHMRLRLEGKGEVRIYSIARILEQGSDV